MLSFRHPEKHVPAAVLVAETERITLPSTQIHGLHPGNPRPSACSQQSLHPAITSKPFPRRLPAVKTQTFSGAVSCQAPECLSQVCVSLYLAGLWRPAICSIEGLCPRAPLPCDLKEAQIPIMGGDRADREALFCQLDSWLQHLEASHGEK